MPMVEKLTFFSPEWITPLWHKLQDIRQKRAEEFHLIEKDFGDPVRMAKFYIEPNCQIDNPADVKEPGLSSFYPMPASTVVNELFANEYSIRVDGKNQLRSEERRLAKDCRT